jgi:hypothetical protein
MKLILITLVAVVVGMMVACSSEPAAPTATPPPAFTDDEVIGAVRGFLFESGRSLGCHAWARRIMRSTPHVRQDTSNRDKYYVTVPGSPEYSYTFIGSLGKVISTSTGNPAYYGC